MRYPERITPLVDKLANHLIKNAINPNYLTIRRILINKKIDIDKGIDYNDFKREYLKVTR